MYRNKWLSLVCAGLVLIGSLDCYRQAEYPWNEDGSVTECINWKSFEKKCINGKVNLIFQKRVCEHPNAKSIIKHYTLNSTRIESIQLARHDVKRFNRYDFYNMRGSPRGSQVLVSYGYNL